MHSLDCLSVIDASDAVPTALLLMDFQRFIVDRFPSAGAVERAAAALAVARSAGIPVVFVRVARRSGPAEDAPETQVVPELAPLPGEPDGACWRQADMPGAGPPRARNRATPAEPHWARLGARREAERRAE